jgi:hypothetical protein
LAASLVLVFLAVTPLRAADPATLADKPAFKQEELEQMLAPIALYPDSLLSQMLMASTYPLEVVQADRWIKANKDIKGDALTAALERESWDPSVKSLANFPQVLAMMSENLDVTVKIGDAFIGQQSQVLATVQTLRAKAQETGNLKTTPEQQVIVEKQVIVIQAANPAVVYIPTYSPTVYYAVWPYPAYPPMVYYPPGYVARPGYSFVAGVAVGAAWGYAWGHCDWHGGHVNVDINRNVNINANINRSRYQAEYQSRNININGNNTFQHDASHRQGVAYRDQKTASQFGRISPADATKARDSYRGRVESGPQDLSRVAPDRSRGTGAVAPTPSYPPRGSTADRSSADRSSAASRQPTPAPRQPTAAPRDTNGFDGVNRGGSTARQESSRGSASRAAPTASGSGSGRGGGR